MKSLAVLALLVCLLAIVAGQRRLGWETNNNIYPQNSRGDDYEFEPQPDNTFTTGFTTGLTGGLPARSARQVKRVASGTTGTAMESITGRSGRGAASGDGFATVQTMFPHNMSPASSVLPQMVTVALLLSSVLLFV
mmetsp:Transcript_51185/g.128426  ORF Transcript_51185/g.128426 Transcript_51185/m.128426 type:complete len:136 (+) Transcript_51185:63-470(+)|eukprot:CAMPEP_0177647446 /NCGR_PEP_ID=MMETSP0447-20121125/10303_1 /TAXON_ID=0 /ORGANISM="Stygamoeba regulata, Strain BSH-02190019" /LENGTH=135 /DNA_ID=CAMNT_0019150029 /DNA_START=74 /DNA_END=481 /DNA_ORIENTATION=-